MKKEKFSIKNFVFIIIGIIIGFIGIVSAYSLFANNIGFQSKDTSWQVDNVKDAIDGLYSTMALKNYSENEKVIGTWIDGKPIYQKTIYIPSLTSQSDYYNTGISNLKNIIDYNGFATDDYNGVIEGWSIVRPGYDGNNIGLAHYKSDGTVQIGASSYIWSRVKDIYITLQYTKTTD